MPQIAHKHGKGTKTKQHGKIIETKTKKNEKNFETISGAQNKKNFETISCDPKNTTLKIYSSSQNNIISETVPSVQNNTINVTKTVPSAETNTFFTSRVVGVQPKKIKVTGNDPKDKEKKETTVEAFLCNTTDGCQELCYESICCPQVYEKSP